MEAKTKENTMKVKIIRYGCTHFSAQCSVCDWNESISDKDNRQDIRNKVRQHVLKTEHTVIIESGTATHYILKV